jgi:hypothetical protein
MHACLQFVNVLMLIFFFGGRIFLYRMEDVLARYINLADHDRGGYDFY